MPDKRLNVLLITPNKSDKDYSPTTMYEDHSINVTLLHWQSQSTTSANSPTGQHYINHQKLGNRILPFVCGFKKNRVMQSAEAYTFFGLANYVKHESSRPMSITWELEKPIPAKHPKKLTSWLWGNARQKTIVPSLTLSPRACSATSRGD